MTRAMMTLISRRAFLGGIGGAIVSGSVLWTYGCPGGWRGLPGQGDSVEPCCQYVDHDGWLLTASDKDKLTASQK